MADRDASRMTGRIYRIAPTGLKPSVPKLNLTTPPGCVSALASPNASTRYVAWMGLKEMGVYAESELLKLWQSSADARMRARALYYLAQIRGTEHEYVRKAVVDFNPDIRIAGLRIAHEVGLDMTPYVKALVYDPADAVRRECAIALRHCKSPEAPRLWATLATQHDGRDRWYLEALGIGMDQQEDKFFEAWLKEVGDKWNTPRGRDIIWRSRSSKAPSYLVKLIADKNTSEADRARYFRALDFIKGPEKDAALLELVTSGTPATN
jgi:hypothetical protein